MSTLGTFAQYNPQVSFSKKNRGGRNIGTQGELALAPKSAPTGLQPRPDRGKSLMGYNAAADKAESAKPNVMSKVAERADVKATKDPVKLAKAKERLASIGKIRTGKNRNLIIGGSVAGGLGLAGLGAIAYNNRNSNRRSEMSFGSAFANFADKKINAPTPSGRDPKFIKSYGEVTDAMRTGTGTSLNKEQSDKLAENKKNKKVMSADDIKSTQDKLKKYAGQRTIEKNIDKGGDIYKGAKGMDYVTRTGALLGSPERRAIEAGKASKNGFIKGSANVAEGFGRLGYKTGAIGGRGVLNKVVGRTATGKVARLGAAGIGLSAIGGAMKRNRQERG